MNTLDELNTRGQTSVTFTDNRTPGPRYDRPAAQNRTQTTEQGLDTPVNFGINIVDVVDPASSTVTLELNFAGNPGATLTFPSPLPSGVTVTTSGTNTYVVNGIDSKADWDAIKPIDIDNGASYVGSYTYICTVKNNSVASAVWEVVLSVTPITNLGEVEDFYFTDATATLVTGAPQIQTEQGTTFTVTVTPGLTASVDTMSSAGSGGTSSFNGTSKVLTLTGTKAQVNSHLSAITFTSTSGADDTTLTYYSTESSATVPNASAVQNIFNTNILSETRTAKTYTPGVQTQIGQGGPQITHNSTSLNDYTMNVTSNEPTKVLLLDTVGYPLWSQADKSITDPDTTHNTSTWGKAMSYIGDDYLIVPDSQADSGGNTPGRVYIYSGIEGTPTLTQTLAPGVDQDGMAFGYMVAKSRDNKWIAVSASDEEYNLGSGDVEYGKVYFWYSATGIPNYTSKGSINYPGSRTDSPVEFGHSMSWSSDGARFIAAAHGEQDGSNYGELHIYDRTGLTIPTDISLLQTITDPFGSGSDTYNDNFADTAEISPDGQYIAVCAPEFGDTSSGFYEEGRVYIYKYNSGTNSFALNATFTGDTRTETSGIHSDVVYTKVVGFTSNSNELIAETNLGFRVFGLTGSTWTLSQTVNSISETSGTTSQSYFDYAPREHKSIRISYDDTYIFAPKQPAPDTGSCYYEIYEKQTDGTWALHTSDLITKSDTNSTGVAVNQSFDRVALSTVAPGSGSHQYGKVSTHQSTTDNGHAWNNSARQLQLNGSKVQVNSLIDNILLTSQTSATGDITLDYDVTTPDSSTDTRTQTVEQQ